MPILTSPLRSILTSPLLASPLDTIGVSGGTTVRTYIVDANGDNIVDLLGNVVFSEIVLRESGDLTFLVDENGAFILDEFGNQVITFVKPEGAVFVVDLNGDRLVDEFGNEVIIAEPSVEVFVTNELGYFLIDEEGNRVVVLEEPTDAFLIDDSGNFIVDLFGRRVVQTLINTDGLSILNERALARFTPASIDGSLGSRTWRNLLNDSDFDLNVRVGTDANLIVLESGVALHTGQSGDYLSTVDSAAARVTDDITLEWIGYLDDWSPGSNMALISKWTVAGNKRSYFLRLNTDGKISLFLSIDGTAQASIPSALPNGFSNGAIGGVRARWNQSANTVDFEALSTGDGSWNAMGSQQTLTLASINADDAIVEIGSSNVGSANLIIGKTVRARIYNDATATNVVVDFDPSKATVNTATFTSGGVVWTANGDAFVNATGHTGLYSRGSVGLETSAGQLITGEVTVIAVFKPTLAAPSADQYLIHARSDAGNALEILTREVISDKFAFRQGTIVNFSETYDSKLRIITAQFLGTAASKLTISDVGSVTGDAGSENWDFGSILMNVGGSLTMQGFFLEYNIIRGTFNEEELVEVVRHLTDEYRYVA